MAMTPSQDQTESPLCAVCGGPMALRFTAPCDYRRPCGSASYTAYWCAACDYGCIWPRPAESDIAAFYDVDYYTHETGASETKAAAVSFVDKLRVHLAWRFDKGSELDPAAVRGLVNETRPSMCEIGCGNGSDLASFQKAGFSVIGVEPDPAARSAAAKTVGLAYDGSAEKLPDALKGLRFDVVLMSHVLEHCLDVNLALANVHSLLKDGGQFIVETPNCGALGFCRYLEAWPWTDVPRHLNFFTTASLQTLCRKHGFNVLDTSYRGYCRQFFNDWLQEEARIWHAFHPQEPVASMPGFSRRAWRFLFDTFLAPPEKKYDSVRVMAGVG